MKQGAVHDSLFEDKVKHVTSGQQAHIARTLLDEIPRPNADCVVDYILAMEKEINPSKSHVRNLLKNLIHFSKFQNHKSFKNRTRNDVLHYLESHRKTDAEDPLHKWIGTYNMRKALLVKFYKWLYYPIVKADERKEPAPVRNISSYKRKEISIYKPEDLWTQDDDLIFLKYCPDERIACYHAMSRDSSARPHELLKLKLKDIQWKESPTGVQYATILVSGKTTQRALPLTHSIPYIKKWLELHPLRMNADAPLFTGMQRTLGKPLTPSALACIYIYYYNKGVYAHGKFYDGYYRRLLKDPSVPQEEKEALQKLLKKPWNPYIRRHTALTEKVRLVKNDFVLKQHAGWGLTSKMLNKYIHHFGTESANRILEEMGIIPKEGESVESNKLKPKICPQCNEPNAHDAPVCIKCRFVLTYRQFAQTVESEKKMVEEMVAKQVQEALRRVDFTKLRPPPK